MRSNENSARKKIPLYASNVSACPLQLLPRIYISLILTSIEFTRQGTGDYFSTHNFWNKFFPGNVNKTVEGGKRERLMISKGRRKKKEENGKQRGLIKFKGPVYLTKYYQVEGERCLFRFPPTIPSYSVDPINFFHAETTGSRFLIRKRKLRVSAVFWALLSPVIYYSIRNRSSWAGQGEE